MSESKVLSFDDFLKTDDMRYVNVNVPGGAVRLGSISSADALAWMAELDDDELKKLHGLRLLARCYVNPDGSRVGQGLDSDARLAAIADAVEKLSRRDSTVNGALCRAARILNGFATTGEVNPIDAAKNDLSETKTEASPIVSLPTAG